MVQAATAFRSYLSQYPNGQYVVNATYWLGELSLKAGDRKAAVQQFTQIVNQYPRSSKVPDALLKLGMIAKSMGNDSVAMKQLTHLQNRYSKTTAAQLARIYMQQIQNKSSS